MSDSVRIDDSTRCGPCWFEHGRLVHAVAVVGDDTVCDDHLDGHCARADIELDALAEYTP